MSDELCDAILAAPDDDGPRLVWADREGGERGELVVVQCALAKPELDPAKRKQLAGRENILLRNAPAWIGATHARATFRRGFVERLEIPVAALARIATDLFTREPALHAIELASLADDANRYSGPLADEVWATAAASFRSAFEAIPSGRVRSLQARPCVRTRAGFSESSSLEFFGDAFAALIAELPSLAGLRELALTTCGVTREAIPHLAQLRALTSLTFTNARLEGVVCGELVAAIPSLRTFAPHVNTPMLNGSQLDRLLASTGIWHLTTLDVSQNDLSEVDKLHITMAEDLGRLRVILE